MVLSGVGVADHFADDVEGPGLDLAVDAADVFADDAEEARATGVRAVCETSW